MSFQFHIYVSLLSCLNTYVAMYAISMAVSVCLWLSELLFFIHLFCLVCLVCFVCFLFVCLFVCLDFLDLLIVCFFNYLILNYFLNLCLFV